MPRRSHAAALLVVAAAACVPDGTPPASRVKGSAGEAAAGDTGVAASTLDAGQVAAPPPPPPRMDAGSMPPAPDPDPAPGPDAGTPPPAPEPEPPRPPAPAPDAGTVPDICTEGPNKPHTSNIRVHVYYGTDTPTHVPLTPGQIMAVGNFGGCSGLLIAPTWVLTASHCGLGRNARFCIGEDPSNANICFSAARIVNNPRGDMTLMELTRDARELAPTVEPVPILAEDMDSGWIGRTAEASGYGRDERGRSGKREFTAEPIARLSGDTVTINGMGQRGVCFGDSGGPLMVIASDGSARVAGALSNGDTSCTGYDNFTRVDTYRTWIEGYVGPVLPPGPRPPDPCNGVTLRGRCDGNTLTWCGSGQVFTRDCQLCGETCLPLDDQVGFVCMPSTCGDLGFLGRCEGNTVVWCNRMGTPQRRDCGSRGCGWISDQTGYYCR